MSNYRVETLRSRDGKRRQASAYDAEGMLASSILRGSGDAELLPHATHNVEARSPYLAACEALVRDGEVITGRKRGAA